jgi:hypothetical protein
MEINDYYDVPIYKAPHIIWSVGLIKGQLKGGSTIDH